MQIRASKSPWHTSAPSKRKCESLNRPSFRIPAQHHSYMELVASPETLPESTLLHSSMAACLSYTDYNTRRTPLAQYLAVPDASCRNRPTPLSVRLPRPFQQRDAGSTGNGPRRDSKKEPGKISLLLGFFFLFFISFFTYLTPCRYCRRA